MKGFSLVKHNRESACWRSIRQQRGVVAGFLVGLPLAVLFLLFCTSLLVSYVRARPVSLRLGNLSYVATAWVKPVRVGFNTLPQRSAHEPLGKIEFDRSGEWMRTWGAAIWFRSEHLCLGAGVSRTDPEDLARWRNMGL